MASILKTSSITRFFQMGVAALATTMLVACGGGGGSAGIVIGSGGASKAGITLELVDATTNASKNVVSTSAPLVARATVTGTDGKPVANTIVNFAIAGTVGVLSPSAGTALTDAAGVAKITIVITDLVKAQAQAGAAETIVATASIGTQALVASLNYKIGVPAVSLRLVTPSSGAANVGAYQTTFIEVDVLADGVVYTAQPVTINFASACTLGGKAVLPTSAITSNGRVRVVYTDKGCGNIDKVTISAAGAASVAVNLNVAAPVAASIGFVSATPSDKAIVIKGAGGIGRTETAVLTFLVLDTFGLPLPNQSVSFTVNPSDLVSLQTSSAISAADGTVVVSVNSGTQPTTFRVTATLASGQSTQSGVITVTTGQPVQAAFSLSSETFNIEGWSIDNQKTKINILIADQFGNPVADGTPVVFQTDSGAIGSSALGGCTTANGACSVDFRSQAPRFGMNNTAGKRAGLATINVSSATALVTLSGQTGVFLSGSSAQNVYLDNVRLAPSSTNAFTTSSCGLFSIQLELNDLNFNPLPFGTAVESANVDLVTVAGIIPDKVPSIGPHDVTGGGNFLLAGPTSRQGSLHTIAVKPGENCLEGSTGYRETGSFTVKITTPLGAPVFYSFTLNYPAKSPTITCTAPQVAQNGVCVTPIVPTISLVLSGTTNNAVGPTHPLTATATVTDSTGAKVPNVVVTFTIADATMAQASPATVLTGNVAPNVGVAATTINRVGATLGATTVTASANIGGTIVTKSVGFSVDNN